MFISKSSERVTKHTPPRVSEKIRLRAERALSQAAQNGPEAVRERLFELDREWDIERAIETQSAAGSLITLLLGRFVNRRFYFLTGVIQAFMLQHALEGWAPQVPVFRRLGFRTPREIEDERNALIQMELES